MCTSLCKAYRANTETYIKIAKAMEKIVKTAFQLPVCTMYGLRFVAQKYRRPKLGIRIDLEICCSSQLGTLKSVFDGKSNDIFRQKSFTFPLQPLKGPYVALHSL